MNKKLLYTVLAGALSISVLAACGGEPAEEAPADEPAVEEPAEEPAE